MPASRSARKQQTRLAFSPLPSSSPAADGYNQQIRDRAAAITLETSPSPHKRIKVATLPTPVASLERPVKASGQMVDGDSDDEAMPTTTHRRRGGKARQQRLDFNSARDADSFDSPIRLPSSTHSRSSGNPSMFNPQGQPTLIDVSSDESDGPAQISSPVGNSSNSRSPVVQNDDEESDAIPVSTARRRKRAVVLEESEDEDGMPTTIGKQKRRPRRRGSNSSFIVDSPPQAVDSDDDVTEVHLPSKKRRRQATESEEEQGDDDEYGPKTPNRRRLKQRRMISQQDRDDLADDIHDLGASSDFEFNPQTSQSTQKSARQAALDRLKRKRTGQLPQVAEEEDETLDKDDEAQEEGNDDVCRDEEDIDDEDDVQITSSRQMFRADDEDVDFIEEAEDEGPLGIQEGMPIGLTRYASMKPKELFKYAVEWMVQKKINPAFSSTDQIYELTFKKLDDELRGMASSKFTSSAWTKTFTLAMQARPEIAYERLDRNTAEHSMRDKCDACNRSGHPATYEMQFRGKPYHRETLEDIADDDDEGENESDSDEDSSDHADEPAYDAQGRDIVAETHTFYVGKFCKSNAETAHSLHHWKHALYDWVLTFLTSRGYFSSEKLVARESWNTKKRRKYANKIVDHMEKEGEVKRLWRTFKEQTDVARNSKQGRFVPDSP